MTELALHSSRIRTAMILFAASVALCVLAAVLRNGWMLAGGMLLAIAGWEARHLASASAAYAVSSRLRQPLELKGLITVTASLRVRRLILFRDFPRIRQALRGHKKGPDAGP